MKLAVALVFLITGCSIPDFYAVNKRVTESLSGTITAPTNIDPVGTNNFSFSVFGDTHVGSPFGSNIGLAIAKSKSLGDSFSIVVGDLTDYSKISQFNEFIESFSSQSMTFRACIGNHDVYFDGWKNFKKLIGPATYSFDADNVHFAMLDSANGVLGQQQLDWLRADLAATSQPIKIIVTHYSPWTGNFIKLWSMSSDEEAAILKDIANTNNVNLVLAAHYHGFVDKTLGVTRYITTGGVNKIIDFGEKKHFVRVTINGTNLSVSKENF